MAGIEPDRIHVVPHGIDRSFQVIADRGRLDAAAGRLGLAGKPFIFYVGGFRKHKNLPMLLRAFRQLRRRGGQDVLLVLAGDHPPYLEQIFQEAQYDEADRAAVRYLGFVSDDDLVVLYNLAICLAFPSRNEGFGLPITEAMACGCPVVGVQRNRAARKSAAARRSCSIRPTSARGPTPWPRSSATARLRSQLRQKGLARAGELNWRKTAEKILSLLA